MQNDYSLVTKPTVQTMGLIASEELFKSFQKKERNISIVGTQSCLALTLLLCEQLKFSNTKAHLVIMPTIKQAILFKEQWDTLCPHTSCHYLPSFDLSPYSGFDPSSSLMAQRVRWLFAASQKTGVFLAHPTSIAQLTLPFSNFEQHSLTLELQQTWTESPHSFLESLGYTESPRVEDIGQFSCRGGIVDVFSPAHKNPLRLELFGDMIEEIRLFDSGTQRSIAKTPRCHIIPAREVFYAGQDRFKIIQRLKKGTEKKKIQWDEHKETLKALTHQNFVHGLDYFLPYFHEKLESPLSYFNSPLSIWKLSNDTKELDDYLEKIKKQSQDYQGLFAEYKEFFSSQNISSFPEDSSLISFTTISKESPLGLEPKNTEPLKEILFRGLSLNHLSNGIKACKGNLVEEKKFIKNKLEDWKNSQQKIFVFCSSESRSKIIQNIFEELDFKAPLQVIDKTSQRFQWADWTTQQEENINLIHLICRSITESLHLPKENFIFLRDSDFIPTQKEPLRQPVHQVFNKKASALSFAELNIDDLIVHKSHGIGLYKGLKVMTLNGCPAELLQLEYKNKDKLYLPIYRIGQIQKYMGPSSASLIDKLGTGSWEKTKTRVKKRLRDIAAELVKLYAKRQTATRPPALVCSQEFDSFSEEFPFQETVDQSSAIQDIINDMAQEKPMDRLICGDVGFGKTEVAMRATFKCIEKKSQVALIAPTTVLTFQHFRNFKKRFKNWPVHIVCLNRFIPKKQQEQNIADTASGKASIIIGTHKLFSKTLNFKDLGLLIIDEEQKFGVKHKEKIRQLKDNVDTLTLSATPIPRTLNMSLVGIRDLSLMNTPPIDRLPTRTFIGTYLKDLVAKGIENEIKRAGQVFFLHNKIQSIELIASEIKRFCPTARVAIAHGQMKEGVLEQVMFDFFNHKIDVLVCTTIIESGIDIPNANTMFINNAHQLGLSQLYQLRGRVGRSKNRAYCYLLVPPNKTLETVAQERLKIIQENSSLGSGIQIAQHDLELRGTGNLLGEDQSGHIHAIGYEMYNELLQQAIKERKGLPMDRTEIEPELNLKIPALIPEKYINNIKIRLSYYKILSDINGTDDLDDIENELTDQFGKPPEEVLNLMGLMLIRKECKELSVINLSSGKESVSLYFTEHTHLSTEKIIALTQKANKKYSITPDNKLIVRIKKITWPRIYEEVSYLNSL